MSHSQHQAPVSGEALTHAQMAIQARHEEMFRHFAPAAAPRSSPAPVIEVPERSENKRGRGAPKGPKSKPVATLKKWVREYVKYGVDDLTDVAAEVKDYALEHGTGIQVDETIGKIYCSVCGRHVPSDKKSRTRGHFGMGGTASFGHVNALLEALRGGPPKQTQLEQGHLEGDELDRFRSDFVYHLLAAGINANQAVHIKALLCDWGAPGFGNSLPNNMYDLFNSQLESAETKMWRGVYGSDPTEGTVDIGAHHLQIDPGTDNAKNKMSVVSTQFGNGAEVETAILDITFLDATNADTVSEQLDRVCAKASETGRVDSVHMDSASYFMKMLRDGRIPEHVLALPDVPHRFDGVLAKIMEPLLLYTFIKYLKQLFNTNNIKWIASFFRLVLKHFANHDIVEFPSPSQTRAWMGDYRIAVWLWTHFDIFMAYVTRYARGFDENPGNEKKSTAYQLGFFFFFFFFFFFLSSHSLVLLDGSKT